MFEITDNRTTLYEIVRISKLSVQFYHSLASKYWLEAIDYEDEIQASAVSLQQL